ncbi:DoxX family protein [Streptomyces sp. NPDC004629]|uniref:DoxX family protein n=1 Tax=Streptomyces sp. NPDC004629 TaxID=3364705 RepID=UPI003698DC1B
MFIAACIVSILLAAVLTASARGKLLHDPKQMETMRKVGFPASKLWLLAGAELAGAAGLVMGLFWWPLGAAAAIGVMGYFVGAVASHLRVRDFEVGPSVVLLAVAAGALALRLLAV